MFQFTSDRSHAHHAASILILSVLLILLLANRGEARTPALYADSAIAIPGSDVTITHYLDHNSAVDCGGWSFAVCPSDPSVCEVTRIQLGVDATGPSGVPPALEMLEIVGPEWGAAVIIDIFFLNTIPAGATGLEIVVADYTVVGDGVCSLDFCEITTPFIELFVANIDGTIPVPLTTSGEISTPQSSFLRGDVDGNGIVTGLLDGFFLLNYQFGSGPLPPCLEAADCDGNGVVTGLTDALYILNFQFNGGAPPPMPWPDCDEGLVVTSCDTSTCP